MVNAVKGTPLHLIMNEYIVSARKYRPLSFDTVIGQSALTTTLKNAVRSGKLAHAYLFCGPRGVGKTTCARIFAKAINCESPTADGEACNRCESCTAFNEGRSYSIFELDAASNNSVENIKTLMEQTRIPPQVGRYKVFIIDEVHMLSTAAFNAFLKTLEEPPAHVIFILATTEKHKILPTIISRCQIYDFERISVGSIVSHLKDVADKEGIKCEEEALMMIAEKADGGMRDALSMFDQAASFCGGDITAAKVAEDLNMLDVDNYFNIIDLAVDNKVADLMVLVGSIIGKGFDGGRLVGGLAAHTRNVLMAKDPQTLPLLEAGERRTERYKSQAAKCPTKFLYKALRLMNDCDINYRQSGNKRLLVELTLIEMAQLTQDDDDGAAGRSPKRLKSLFRKIIDSAMPKAAEQVAAAERKTTNIYMPGDRRGVAPGAPDHRDISSRSTAKLKIGAINTGFDKRKTPRPGSAPIPKPRPDTPQGEKDGDNIFSPADLEQQWQAMCKRMPTELKGLSSRMKALKPQITEFPNVEITVDNRLFLEKMQTMKGRIRATLAGALDNNNLTINVRLSEIGEMTKIPTRREMLQQMMADNPAMKRLCDTLDFELV